MRIGGTRCALHHQTGEIYSPAGRNMSSGIQQKVIIVLVITTVFCVSSALFLTHSSAVLFVK